MLWFHSAITAATTFSSSSTAASSGRGGHPLAPTPRRQARDSSRSDTGWARPHACGCDFLLVRVRRDASRACSAYFDVKCFAKENLTSYETSAAAWVISW